MATQTLAEAKKFINDDIISGVAQDIITVDPMYSVLPWTGFSGQGIILNREDVLGDSDFYGVGDTITANAPASYVQKTFTPTKIVGDAEMDYMVQATSVSDGVDMQAQEISSKAKSVGRKFQKGIAVGTAAGNDMESFHTLCDAGQYTTASAGQALDFTLLDELEDLVLAKDGQVDWIQMAKRTMRSYLALLRSANGTPGSWIMTLPDGRKVAEYNGVPIFKSGHLSVTETANGAALVGDALTSVWAGCWDDGSNKIGISAIHPISTPAGLSIQRVGTVADRDAEIMRVKMYANLALFNRKGLARLTSINN